MTKQEWQQFYGFSDEEMAMVVLIKSTFNGTVHKVNDRPWNLIPYEGRLLGDLWSTWMKGGTK